MTRRLVAVLAMLAALVMAGHGQTGGGADSLAKPPKISALAYPFWDPLLSWMVGGSVSCDDMFRTGVNATADMLVSIRNMWFANLTFVRPDPVPGTGLRVAAHFDNQNRLFYGIGNDSRLAGAIEYSNLVFRENVAKVAHLGGPWRAAGSVQLEQVTLGRYDGRGLEDTLVASSGGNEVLFGLGCAHDTREHVNNPRAGHYLALSAQLAPRVMPHGHAFGKLMLDLRGYLSPARRHTVAGRVVVQQAFGTVPFYDLPEFGGDTLGRGFLPYRFRDRSAVTAQLEYRFPVWSFISGAAFVDVGQFQPGFRQFELSGFHPAVGFGPRLSFGKDESSIVGIDVGFTPEGWNLVLHNGQVF